MENLVKRTNFHFIFHRFKLTGSQTEVLSGSCSFAFVADIITETILILQIESSSQQSYKNAISTC